MKEEIELNPVRNHACSAVSGTPEGLGRAISNGVKIGKLLEALKGEPLHYIKRAIAKKLKIPVLSNIDILKAYHKYCQIKRKRPDKKIEYLLIKRRVRSLSGVAVVSVLTKPYPCPGECLYCPAESGMPKSYLSNEPAVMRAVLNNFNPYNQVKTRLESLTLTGHPTDKIELIVIGGTWSFLPRKYQNWFITQCFNACNNYKSKGLIEAQKKNEKAKHRIIGITIETRPDYINPEEIKNLRILGATRVEIGVQTVYDDILKYNKRGHSRKEIIKATKLLKDAGFKVCYHMMPNLPGSNLKKDLEMFKELFSNSDFQPDLLKIYPCAILKQAPLYNLWKKNKYKPYTKKQLIDLLKKIKETIPYFVRIQRLTRDIPSQSIVEGPAKISNMRQVLVKEGVKCKCIRCREVKENYNPKEKLYLFRQSYLASGGKEIFLSYESKDRKRLYSLLRLRINNSPGENCSRPNFTVLKNAAIIRELHTYGQLQSLGHRVSQYSPQHKGLGKKLMKEAERIVYTELNRSAKKESKAKKIAVISGVGARGYYRKLGYRLKNTYMVKKL